MDTSAISVRMLSAAPRPSTCTTASASDRSGIQAAPIQRLFETIQRGRCTVAAIEQGGINTVRRRIYRNIRADGSGSREEGIVALEAAVPLVICSNSVMSVSYAGRRNQDALGVARLTLTEVLLRVAPAFALLVQVPLRAVLEGVVTVS